MTYAVSHDHPILLGQTDLLGSGVHPWELPSAIAELEALGFIEVVGLDEHGVPNRFRVSDGWRDIKARQQARAAKRRARSQWGWA
jgi:hypothetical protein